MIPEPSGKWEAICLMCVGVSAIVGFCSVLVVVALPREKPAPVCPPQVVWNPLWSENPDGIGGRISDRRRLTDEQRRAVLEAQLQDPYRHPLFDSELRREIARLK